MGLDSVEFLLAVEQTFDLAIPDADASQLATPWHVVDYLERRLRSGAKPGCLEQRAFHRVRRAGMELLGHPRAAFVPDARWADLLPREQQARHWDALGAAVGLDAWPPRPGFLRSGPETVGATATLLATRNAAALLKEGEGWTRPRIAEGVTRLMADELGIQSFRWDDRFGRDLGVD